MLAPIFGESHDRALTMLVALKRKIGSNTVRNLTFQSVEDVGPELAISAQSVAVAEDVKATLSSGECNADAVLVL